MTNRDKLIFREVGLLAVLAFVAAGIVWFTESDAEFFWRAMGWMFVFAGLAYIATRWIK